MTTPAEWEELKRIEGEEIERMRQEDARRVLVDQIAESVEILIRAAGLELDEIIEAIKARRTL